MSDIKEELCYVMHKFVKEHIDELDRPASSMCDDWKNEKQMLRSIKNNVHDAGWALCELCTWGLNEDYSSTVFSFDLYEDEDGLDVEIFRIVDRKGNERFFKIDAPDNWNVIEVNRITRMVEVATWEEQK